MSFPEANDLKEQVREATDIVALVGSYLDLTPQGRDHVGICPFHDDTKPSLRVNPDRQNYKCWSCGEGGDVFSFVMKRENVDFPGAMRILAERAGIELRPTGPKAAPGSPNDKATLYKAMEWAETQFHRFLLEGSDAAVARDYLRERSINEDSIRRYQIGFAPNEWQWLTNRARSSYSPAVLEALGLVVRKENGRSYDRFRGRVMFPIRDTQNRPIAVGGRILPQYAEENPAKYINSPETRLYSKSQQLYGLSLCRDSLEEQRKKDLPRNVIVMEGYTDVVVARQEGIGTPVAVCGTSLTEKHITLLKRYADRVTLVLDGDKAGQDKAASVLEMFVAGQIELRMVSLPDGMDPCDYVLKHGADQLQQLIEQSPDALEFCVKHETAGIDLANDTIPANAALQRILKTMSKAPRLKEDTDSSFRLREQQTLSRLSRMFRVDEPVLRKQLTTLRSSSKTAPNRFRSEPEVTGQRTPLNSWERELFALLIQNPDAIAAVIEKIAPEEMRTETGQSLLLIYQDLDVTGRIASYENVMNVCDDQELKSIVVELGEEADRKTPEDGELQLRELLAAFANRREKKEMRQHLAELQSGKLNKEEELDLLNRLFDSKRID